MGISGNSLTGKSYMSFTISEDLLQKVTEAVQAGEKQARSSGDIQSFEIFSHGFRQNIALGRLYVIPASICSERKNFPTALLYGSLVRIFGTGGEELSDFVEKKIGQSSFDEYSQADFDTIKEKLFGVGDGKFESLVLFAPSWLNKREYVAFKFTKDEAQLKNNLRHQVFAAYYDPRLSSAFNALMTKVDTTRVDVTDITPKLNFPFLAENVLKQYPDLRKRGSNTKKILLNRRTADAIAKEVLDPQELDVFESLDQALTEALMPGVEDAEKAGKEHHSETEGKKVPRVAAQGEREESASGSWEVDCPKCGIYTQHQKGEPTICPKCKNPDIDTAPAGKNASKTAHIGTDGKCTGCDKMAGECSCTDCHCAAKTEKNIEKCEGCGKSREVGLIGLCKSCVKKEDKKDDKKKACVCHEAPFTNVGPGTEAADKQAETVKGVKEDTAFVNEKKGEPPIGIAIDETGIPRRKEEEAKAKKALAIHDLSHPETLRVDQNRLSSAYSAAYDGGFVDKHAMPPKEVREFMANRLGGNSDYAPQSVADHNKQIEAGVYGDDPFSRRAQEKWGSANIKKAAQKIKADFIAEHIAANFDKGHEVASEKTKKANAEREAHLEKLRPKKAVALDIDDIWAEITENMGPAPVVDIPAGNESGRGKNTGRPNKKDIGSLPEALRGNEPEDNKAMSDSKAKAQENSMPEAKHSGGEPESGKPWHVSSSMEDFVKEAYDSLESDEPKYGCDQCQMLSINGVPTHELGCLNSKKTWVPGRGWVRYVECRECGAEVEEGERHECGDDWYEEPDLDEEGNKTGAKKAPDFWWNRPEWQEGNEFNRYEFSDKKVRCKECGAVWDVKPEHGTISPSPAFLILHQHMVHDAYGKKKAGKNDGPPMDLFNAIFDLMDSHEKGTLNEQNWQEVEQAWEATTGKPFQGEVEFSTQKLPIQQAPAKKAVKKAYSPLLMKLLELQKVADEMFPGVDLNSLTPEQQQAVEANFQKKERGGNLDETKKKADTADNPYNWVDGKGAPEDKKNHEKADTSGPGAPPPGQKKAALPDERNENYKYDPHMEIETKPIAEDPHAPEQHPSPYSGEPLMDLEASAKTAELTGMPLPELLEAINFLDGDGLVVTDFDLIADDIEASVYQIKSAQDLADVINNLDGAGLVVEDPEQVLRRATQFYNDYTGSQRPKLSNEIQPDVAQAKSETESPDTVDKNIKQPTMSVEEAAKVSADISGDAAEAKAETVSPDTIDPNIQKPTKSVEEAAKAAGRHDDVPVAQGETESGKQPTSDLGGVSPEAHDVPPQVDSKTSALTSAEQEEDALNGICPRCHGEDTENVHGETERVLYCHDCGTVTWTFGMGKAAAAGDDLPEEIPIDFGAGDLTDIVMAEDGADGEAK